MELNFKALLMFVLAGRSMAQSAVSAEVYSQIQRYTAFSAAAYADVCTTPPAGSTVVRYLSDAATDTQATIFGDSQAKQLVVAFRGTSSPKDLDSDFAFSLVPLKVDGTSCSDCKVHEGFQAAYNAIASQVLSVVKSSLGSNPGYSLVVTGHSLGGGIAAIASASLAASGQTVTTYTFGEPRNGNAAWGKYVTGLVPDSRYFRVTHANDGVPQIPPTLLGYAHHGPEYWEKAKDANDASTTVNCGLESSKCNAAQNFGENPINRAHLTYSSTLVGSSLNITACGGKS